MVLTKFGFKGSIMSAILALYSTASAHLFTSGPLSIETLHTLKLTYIETHKHLSSQLPYSWADQGIPYLGITLFSFTTKLAYVNLKPLIHKIQEDTQ